MGNNKDKKSLMVSSSLTVEDLENAGFKTDVHVNDLLELVANEKFKTLKEKCISFNERWVSLEKMYFNILHDEVKKLIQSLITDKVIDDEDGISTIQVFSRADSGHMTSNNVYDIYNTKKHRVDPYHERFLMTWNNDRPGANRVPAFKNVQKNIKFFHCQIDGSKSLSYYMNNRLLDIPNEDKEFCILIYIICGSEKKKKAYNLNVNNRVETVSKIKSTQFDEFNSLLNQYCIDAQEFHDSLPKGGVELSSIIQDAKSNITKMAITKQGKEFAEQISSLFELDGDKTD